MNIIFLKFCPMLVDSVDNIGNIYQKKSVSSFLISEMQWSKLYLSLIAQPEIQILKGL